MSGSKSLLREIELLDERIEELQDYLCEAESYPPQTSLRGRLSRAISLFLLKREVTRQIGNLRLRRAAARNCYLAAIRREERADQARRASRG
jgi:hypothetical protein